MSVKVDIKYNNTLIDTISQTGVIEYATSNKYLAHNLKVEFTGTEDATATANKILSGYSGYIADGSKTNGTIQAYNSEYIVPLPVGGKIFYIGADNGATYKFYDTNGTEITTQTIEGLSTAVTYSIIGTPSADKFYVVDNTTHTTGDFVATNGFVSGLYWGHYGVFTGANSRGVGSGKLNTNTVLSYGVPTDLTPNIWQYVVAANQNKLNGCTDWYITGSNDDDSNALYSGGVISIPLGVSLTSYEANASLVAYWSQSTSSGGWNGRNKNDSPANVVLIRSF